MSERESYEAIEARRNAPRGGGKRDDRLRHDALYNAPWRIRRDLYDLLAERDALAATLQRVRVEVESIPDFARGPDVQRRLRAALAPSDPATDTGGEGRG